MADWLTRKQRSRNMSSIRSTRNRSTEQAFLQVLRRGHISGWRRHLQLPGKPDFAFPLQKVVVFVDGCFWHGCPKCYRLPEDNRAYWVVKLNTNRRRDRRVSRLLCASGWKVLRIWEHTLETDSGKRRALRKLTTALELAE
jgi:DNA mismatch endonuclease (patch repair protein)